jgi:hypothetical protein
MLGVFIYLFEYLYASGYIYGVAYTFGRTCICISIRLARLAYEMAIAYLLPCQL